MRLQPNNIKKLHINFFIVVHLKNTYKILANGIWIFFWYWFFLSGKGTHVP